MSSLFALKQEFLQYIEIEKGRSALTVRNYDHYLSRFLEFAEKQHGVTSPSMITEQMMRKYRIFLNRYPARKAKKGQAQDVLDKKNTELPSNCTACIF
jgi:site-specific recombinase XerD